MKRSTFRRLLLAIAVGGAVIAVAGTVALSYYQSRSDDEKLLIAGSMAWRNEVGSVLTEARTSLQKLAKDIEGKTPEEDKDLLQQLIFDKPVFREAGLMVNGELVCTSFSIFNPPLPAWSAEHATIPAPGRLHIVPPSATLLGGPSLMVNYRVSDNTLVNVLISPRAITDPLRYVIGSEIYGQYLLRGDGQILLEPEGARRIAPPPDSLPPGGISDVGGSIIYCSEVDGFDVYIVMIMPRREVAARWYSAVPVYALLGIVCAGLFLAGAWQLKSRFLGPEAELREAILSGQIEAFYQPVLDLKTGQCCGAEALARWRHPKRGLIPPALFVLEAEKFGLISPLTLAVIESVATKLAETLKERPELRVNINISSQSLGEAYFFTDCLGITRGRVSSSQLCFEITESTLMGAPALVAMNEFKRHGIWLGVDDFGTGYSNLRYLKDFPFDCLKIDKAFVEGIDPADRGLLVDHIIAIGKGCGLILVAEGIETAEQADYLAKSGVEFGQGFYFARPMAAEDFQQWLAENDANVRNNPDGPALASGA